MFNNIFNFLKKIIKSSMLIYAYDSFCVGLNVIIPINFINILIVYIFGFYGIVGLIVLSFLI